MQTVTWEIQKAGEKEDTKTKLDDLLQRTKSVFDTSNFLNIQKKVSKVQNSLNFTIKKDFKLTANSLKIACGFPEVSDPKKIAIMEVFIFLKELNVEDRANPTWQYRTLFDYNFGEKKHHKRTHTNTNKEE